MFWKRKKKTAKQEVDHERRQIKQELEESLQAHTIVRGIPQNNNWRGNKYAERLVTEWLEHDKIILAVDFDDTISPWKFKGFEANVDFLTTMEIIRLAQSTGCYIAIWTACSSDRFDEIRAYCVSQGMRVDSINENPISVPYGNHKKIYYNHLLDDRAGLTQALSILEYACYRVMSDRKPKTENFDV